MNRIKHLLFDCDGVLVDTEYTAAVKMTQTLKKFGVIISVDYYLQNFTGTTFSSIISHYFENSFSQSEVLEIINGVEDEVTAEVKLIDGVKEVLTSSPINKSVVSNSSVQTVEQALAITGISSQFSAKIFSSELVEHPKPAPDIYQLAVASLGYKEEEVIVVEDSLSGARAALTAGLIVIGFLGGSHILPGHGQRLMDIGVGKIANNMNELGEILTTYNP